MRSCRGRSRRDVRRAAAAAGAERWGDARRALECCRLAGERAERLGAEAVTEATVDEVFDRVRDAGLEQRILGLPTTPFLVLLSICEFYWANRWRVGGLIVSRPWMGVAVLRWYVTRFMPLSVTNRTLRHAVILLECEGLVVSVVVADEYRRFNGFRPTFGYRVMGEMVIHMRRLSGRCRAGFGRAEAGPGGGGVGAVGAA